MNSLNLYKIQNQSKIKVYGKYAIILTFIVILLSYPYVLRQMIPAPAEQVIAFLCMFLILPVLLKCKNGKRIPNAILYCFILQAFFWTLFYTWHSDSSYLVRVFFLILTYIFIQSLLQTNSLKVFILINNKFVTLQSVLAALGFILVFIGILPVINEFANTDGRTLYWYLITCTNMRVGEIIRPSGFFDEPGALAYWGIFALIFNKMFFDSRKIEICLIISLFATLSAAYFVQIFVYFLCFYSNKRGIAVLLGVFVILSLIIYYLGDNETLRYLTVDRFSGDGIRSERTELSEIAKGYFLKNPIMGIGAQNMENIMYMADNPYEIPAKDGIIGTFVTYLPYLFILFKYGRNKKVLYSVIILALGYLQRPFHINELHYLMMYSFVIMVVLKYRRNDKKRGKSFSSDCMLQLS